MTIRLNNKCRSAFSLLELVVVLVVVSLLAAASVPLLQRELETAARVREAALLQQIDSGFEFVARRQGIIPGPTNWANAMAAPLRLATSGLLTNSAGNRRVLLVDPRFRLGPTNAAGLPFAQTDLGAAAPTNTRVLVVSSLGPPLPVTVTADAPVTAAEFDALWSLSDRAVPQNWNWTGGAEDLLLRRLDLGRLFHPVLLNDLSLPPGRYSVNGATNRILPSVPFATHLLAGSVLGLHGSDGSLQSLEVVGEPGFFSFEAGNWRRRSLSGMEETILVGADLATAAAAFNAAPFAGNISSAAVFAAMTNWLGRYNAWSAAGYPSTGPIFAALQSARTALANGTASLVDAAN